MSIVYARIDTVDYYNKNHKVINYSVTNIFKDMNEVLSWFAYDYGRQYTPPFKNRFEELVNDQNLNGTDVYCPHPLADNPVHFLRGSFLYDTDHDTVIDIRKYEHEIESCRHTVMKTEWQSPVSKKHSRRHQRKYRSGRNTALYHDAILRSDRRYTVVDADDNIVITCKIPALVRGSKKDIKFGKTVRQTENNWKNKKIRYQWQYHTSTSYKSHHKQTDKGCDKDWLVYDENELVPKMAS